MRSAQRRKGPRLSRSPPGRLSSSCQNGVAFPTVLRQAHDDPTQLTDEERQLLLSRGDVVGKALATPNELTTAEIHEVLLWPPPDVTSANIQRATGGTLKLPVELFAEAKDAIDRRQLDTLLSHEEMGLLARFFHGPDDEDFSHGEKKRRVDSPGPGGPTSWSFP